MARLIKTVVLLFLSACFYGPIIPHGVRGGFQRTMTSFRVQLEKFYFNHQEEWSKSWRRRFERFRQPSGLAKEEEEESQINTLIYPMGDQADDILNSFKLSTTQL